MHLVPRGDTCAIVDDPGASVDWRRVFSFYRCHVYAVQNWRSGGSMINNQTGNARTTYPL